MSRMFSATTEAEVTPTISTSAYAAADQLGGLQTLTSVCPDRGDGSVTLASVSVVDIDDNGAEIDLFFYTDSPTVASSDNAAANVADGEQLKCRGHVTITAGSYKAMSANSVGCVKNVGLQVQGDDNGNIYVLAVIREAATYSTTSALTFYYNFYQDM